MGLQWDADAHPLTSVPVPDLMLARSPAADRPEALVAEHFVPIYSYLARRVGRGLADDLAAEVFALALRDRDKFDPALGSWRMWLFGIATNLVAKHRRAERRRLSAYARAGSRVAVPEHRSATDEIDDRLSAEEALRQLAEALKRLSANQRDVLYMIGIAELSYDETAVALGIPIGTVRSRASRARAVLRAQLERSGHHDR